MNSGVPTVRFHQQLFCYLYNKFWYDFQTFENHDKKVQKTSTTSQKTTRTTILLIASDLEANESAIFELERMFLSVFNQAKADASIFVH